MITLSNNNVLVLLSGGIDSTVALWKMKEQGYNLYTITFNYFKLFLIIKKMSLKFDIIYLNSSIRAKTFGTRGKILHHQ